MATTAHKHTLDAAGAAVVAINMDYPPCSCVIDMYKMCVTVSMCNGIMEFAARSHGKVCLTRTGNRKSSWSGLRPATEEEYEHRLL